MFQQQQQQQQRFPPIKRSSRFKLLRDVTQQPYRIGMVQYYPNNPKTIFENDSGTDRDDPDPGQEVVERNRKERLKRIADSTKDELETVLKRVDNTLTNYENSVQSSLIQHGMRREDMNNVEHVQDIRELEYLLNDSLAKQRYKQRLMVFIVGQTEQASEKAQLLQQIGQFFTEQKQNFSGPEFNDYDDTGETKDEIEATLKAFDVKDCYLHVKTLTSRINELNEEIIQFLIQNTGTKQTKVMVERGKRKLAQVTKEAKEQLADLQSKLEMANAEMMNKDGKIQTFEKDIETVRNEVKTSQENQKKIQDELKKREAEVKYFKRKNNEFEEIINRYKTQVGDLSGTLSFTSQSETEDGDDASKMNLETIDENESKFEKESISSRTGRDQFQSGSIPPTATDLTNNTNKTGPTSAAPQSTAKTLKKSKSREKNKRAAFRSKKEATNQPNADDPSEIYRRSQQLLESLLADKSETAPDLNSLFKPTRGIDLNNVTIDNLPTAFTNLRRFAITRVRELVKELETKESANKETVQILKQEFVEHKTTYEKERLLYFLSLDPDENTWQEEQNALVEKADNAHKLQIRAQKTAEDALNHLELFMAEQEKLDQQDVVRQTELVHRHSVVVNNMTGANITPPDPTEPIEEPSNDRLSPNPKRSTPSKTQWQKISSIGTVSPKPTSDESKSTIYETAQTLKRLSSSLRKTPPPHGSTQRTDSLEQPSPPTPSLRKTTQELLRKKSSLEQPQHDRSTSSSRRISMAINDDAGHPLSKMTTPQAYDRTPSMHSRPLTRSNSMNPANKDLEKSSSGERSYHTSGAQSRRVSIGLNRSPVRAEELEVVLTKLVNEEIAALENFRRTSVKSRTSLREKYMSLLEEKKHELDDLKQLADQTLSRPTTSTKERKPFESLENSTNLIKKQLSFSALDTSNPAEILQTKENRTPIVKHDQEQQTSIVDSRPGSVEKDKLSPPQIIQNDHYKVPFFHLYETIYKFRHSIINLLEQNQFLSLADRLDMIKQLSSSDNNLTNDFVDNSERVLKDTVKVLQTCLVTVISAKAENDQKDKEASFEQSKTPVDMSTNENQIVQEKELIIEDMNNKYQQMTRVVDQNKKKHEDELIQNERTIVEQQKLIQNLQRELMRLQKRLLKVETEGIVQPSIMFTRLDAERNDQTLQQAVEKGTVSETISQEIHQNMADYNRLPGQQFTNIVKRYIQHRKATQLTDRIQSETFDNETKSVMEKMGSFYKQRSGQISERISSIRQHRSTLARTLTDKFDHLEHESSIFLVRPVYSNQGRAAVQSYMKNERRQEESALKGTNKKKKQRSSDRRRSISTGDRRTELKTASSSTSTSDEDERLFQIDKSFTMARPTPASQQSIQHADSIGINPNQDNRSKFTQSLDLPRLQEIDIQRTLMPMSHPSVPLSTINANSGNDPTIPSSNLRSYVALSRPGIQGNNQNAKSIDVTNPVSRIELSVLSETSQLTNPRTPYNSTVGISRRTSPPLPPIKRSFTISKTPPPPPLDEKQGDEFVPSVSIDEFSRVDPTIKDINHEKEF